MLDNTDEKLADAMRQGQAQFDSIREMVDALQAADGADFASPAIDEARDRILEDALSVDVRSGWYSPGADLRGEDAKPAQYTILLCTGGPACRIIGELSEHGEPETARLEVQDWFTPWAECRPKVGTREIVDSAGNTGEIDTYDSEPTLLAYASCFYFGD